MESSIVLKRKVPVVEPSGKEATFTLDGSEVEVLMPVSFKSKRFDLDTLKQAVDELVEARDRWAE